MGLRQEYTYAISSMMAWPIKVNLNDLGFTTIGHGNLLHDLMCILTPGLTMKEVVDQAEVDTVATAKVLATHSDVCQ